MVRNKIFRVSTRNAGIALTIFSLFLIGIGATYQSDPQQLPYSKQLKTTPITDSQITLKLTYSNGEVMEVSQVEGGMIRTRLLSGGPVMGLIPLIDENGQVQVRIFELDTIQHGEKALGETLSEFQSLTLDGREARVLNGNLDFSVALVGVDKKETCSKKKLTP
jgi:hypothetical protein